MTSPTVSCIMPTRNHRRFVGQAIWYFLRQDYPARELIVVDDGEDSIADLIPNDARIRYVRLDTSMSLGDKRNAACALGQGLYIAHWETDDWIGPQRLSTQVAAIEASCADVCSVDTLLHLRLETGEAWLCHD